MFPTGREKRKGNKYPVGKKRYLCEAVRHGLVAACVPAVRLTLRGGLPLPGCVPPRRMRLARCDVPF